MVSKAQKLELIQMILKVEDDELLAIIKGVLQGYETTASSSSPLTNHIRPFGFAKGLITYVSPDFDATPTGFEDYFQQP